MLLPLVGYNTMWSKKQKSIIHKMAEWTKIFDQIEKVQIKSVTDALFKYGFIGFAIGSIGIAIGKSPQWASIVIFSFSGLFLLIGLIIYVYFAFKKPEYLRSENFQLRMKSIELLGDKENADNPNIIQLPAITNPHAKMEIGEEKPKSIEG